MASVDRNSQEEKSFFFDCKHGRSCIEKRFPQKVALLVQLNMKGEGSCCCAFAWWESWEGENPRWRTMCFHTPTSNISARRQTFRLGFVKHFGSASNISARRSQMLGTNQFDDDAADDDDVVEDDNAHF